MNAARSCCRCHDRLPSHVRHSERDLDNGGTDMTDDCRCDQDPEATGTEMVQVGVAPRRRSRLL